MSVVPLLMRTRCIRCSISISSTHLLVSQLQQFPLSSHNHNHHYPLLQIQSRSLAGHNKWSKIKHKKGAKDAVKSKQFAKASRAIEAASRACSGDMANVQLQTAVSWAKSLQLSKDKIQDAIHRGQASGNTNSKKEDGALLNLRYDGTVSVLGKKLALIILALTDNRNRTAGRLRSILVKNGGELLPTGGNEWLFRPVGLVTVRHFNGNGSDSDSESESWNASWDEETMDRIMECALDGGATHVELVHDSAEEDHEHGLDSGHAHVRIQCEPASLHTLVTCLREAGYTLEEFAIRYMVKDDETNSVSLQDEEGSDRQFSHVLDILHDDDDVIEVYHNAI